MKRIPALIILPLFLFGCSALTDTTIRVMSPVSITPLVNDIVDTAFRGGDMEMVRRGVPTAIILLEGIEDKAPEDRDLKSLLAMLYFAYSFAFADGVDPEWSNQLYQRGAAYGLDALGQDEQFAKYAEAGDWKAAAGSVGESYVPAIFWSAINRGMYVNNNKRNPHSLMKLPSVLALMDRVIELDESFFYGGAHLFYGAYYAGLPVIAGGGPVKSEQYFNKAKELSGGNFLMVDLFYARYYATLIKDEELYRSTLQKIIDAPDDILPEMTLLTRVTKKKAVQLLENADDYLYGGRR